MQITSKLKMDMTKPDLSLSVNAVQGDAYSRNLCISLYSGIVPWTIPEGVTVAVRYSKSDHTKGYYDTLPDGSRAWNVQENILTVMLAPQMLTVPGKVTAQIELILGSHILSTFSLTVHVAPNPAAGVLKSEDYTNWLQWFRDQTDERVLQVHQSVQESTLASEAAIQASENAAVSAINAAVSADCAQNASYQAVDAAASAAASQQKAESVAANISVIVARNEAYTKQESDIRYSHSIFEIKTGTSLTLSDSTSASLHNLNLYGKTTQTRTPTPEAPVELVNVGDGGSITVNMGTSETDENPQTLTVSTPNGLPGIPVSSGGNYTDENGQQWVCDEVDFEKGVYHKRVDTFSGITFSKYSDSYNIGTSSLFAYQINKDQAYNKIQMPSIASHFTRTTDILVKEISGHYVAYGYIYARIPGVMDETEFNSIVAGLTFVAESYEPEEITLSEIDPDALTAYATLHTNYPNTTVFNDGGAYMEVQYVADTKLYVDKKFAELATAIVNT